MFLCNDDIRLTVETIKAMYFAFSATFKNFLNNTQFNFLHRQIEKQNVHVRKLQQNLLICMILINNFQAKLKYIISLSRDKILTSLFVKQYIKIV